MLKRYTFKFVAKEKYLTFKYKCFLGGTCSSNPATGAYICTCITGYTGANCAISKYLLFLFVNLAPKPKQNSLIYI